MKKWFLQKHVFFRYIKTYSFSKFWIRPLLVIYRRRERERERERARERGESRPLLLRGLSFSYPLHTSSIRLLAHYRRCLGSKLKNTWMAPLDTSLKIEEIYSLFLKFFGIYSLNNLIKFHNIIFQ